MNLATKVFKFVQQSANHPIVKAYNSSGIIGKLLLWLVVNILFTTNGLYFQILDSHLGFLILKRLFFLPPLVVIAAIVIV